MMRYIKHFDSRLKGGVLHVGWDSEDSVDDKDAKGERNSCSAAWLMCMSHVSGPVGLLKDI
jgi:hypothetical protein